MALPVKKRFTMPLYPVKERFISAEEIKEVEGLLKKLKCSPSKGYREWVTQREKSIKTVGLLQKKLENIHQGCNTAHGVGAALEVVGGIAFVAGTILTVCGHKSVGKFLTVKASTATAATGLATTVTSSLAEVGLTHQVLNEVKSVLTKDTELTRSVLENLKLSRDIEARLSRIFNCSVLSNIFEDVIRLCSYGFSLLQIGCKEFTKLKDELQRKARKCADFPEYTETVIQNVCKTMENIFHDPKAREAVLNICNIFQESPFIVKILKMGVRICFQACDILKVDCFSSLLTCGVLWNTSAGVMGTKCLFGGIQIAVKLLAVISAVQEVQKGSSKYSEMLKELKVALALELDTVRKNNPELF